MLRRAQHERGVASLRTTLQEPQNERTGAASLRGGSAPLVLREPPDERDETQFGGKRSDGHPVRNASIEPSCHSGSASRSSRKRR
jgi:hypothetical protein